MKEWFENLSEQERQLVLISGIAAGILVILVVWFLYQSSVSSLRSKVEREEQRVYEYAQIAAQVKAAKTSGGGSASKRGSLSLTNAINRSAGKYNLSIKRFDPKKDNKAQVTMENVKFNDVIKWLHELDNSYGIQVDNVNIRERKEAGRVEVSVRLIDMEGQ
ncbi:MAG: type II secretion system protein M [Pseudomonadota bacterium]